MSEITGKIKSSPDTSTGKMPRTIRAGIIGGAGYTGGELLRLLIRHPGVTITYIHSRSQAGKPVHSVHGDLVGDTDLLFSDKLEGEIDVLFLCLGHGESRKFLFENIIPNNVRIIDLANDFRLSKNSILGERQFIYGLPELNREQIVTAKNIANPGCFATCIQVGLLPLAKEGLLEEIHTTAITGSTGAGQTLAPTSHFSWRTNNIQAYKSLTHQHLAEISESLAQLQKKKEIDLSFIPWRGDFARGIFASSVVHCEWELEELYALFESFYKDHPFTIVSREAIYLKQVINTNKSVVQLEKAGSKLVIHSATDNLLKGASGQAVQNMNLMFGFKETTGLMLKPSGF